MGILLCAKSSRSHENMLFILVLHVTSGEYLMKFATHSLLNVLITIIFGTTKTCNGKVKNKILRHEQHPYTHIDHIFSFAPQSWVSLVSSGFRSRSVQTRDVYIFSFAHFSHQVFIEPWKSWDPRSCRKSCHSKEIYCFYGFQKWVSKMRKEKKEKSHVGKLRRKKK